MTMPTTSEISRYENFDARLSWSSVTHASSTIITGMLRNIRYALMENIEVWVILLDAKGKKINRGTDFIIGRLARDEQAPFSVTLPAVAVPGCRLAFTYKYLGDETAWQQSFEVDFAA